jgi:hypothetical protein
VAGSRHRAWRRGGGSLLAFGLRLARSRRAVSDITYARKLRAPSLQGQSRPFGDDPLASEPLRQVQSAPALLLRRCYADSSTAACRRFPCSSSASPCDGAIQGAIFLHILITHFWMCRKHRDHHDGRDVAENPHARTTAAIVSRWTSTVLATSPSDQLANDRLMSNHGR